MAFSRFSSAYDLQDILKEDESICTAQYGVHYTGNSMLRRYGALAHFAVTGNIVPMLESRNGYRLTAQ